MCSSGAWAFSSGKPKPIRTHGTLKVSYICVTKGMEPPSRMKTAFLPNPFSKADWAFLKMGLLYGATHGFPVLKTSNCNGQFWARAFECASPRVWRSCGDPGGARG